MKRVAAAICLALMLLCLAFPGFAQANNMLPNPGFEKTAGDSQPADWYATAYRGQAGYSRMALTSEKAYSGQYSVVVENASSNDARFTCTVKVRPERMYRLSGYVLVDSMEDLGNGANFAVEGIYAISEGLFDTDGQWQYLEWYGETGPDQTEVTIGVRVGGYSAESVGKAYFDDLCMEEVDELPKGVTASLWYDAYAGYQPASSDDETDAEKKTVLYVLLAAGFALVCFLMQPVINRGNSKAALAAFVCVMLAALAARLALGAKIPGYNVDISCFTAWSSRMYSLGPAGFYAPDYFCDYPPGAMLLLWPVGWLLSFAQTSEMMLLAVKSLPILCDLLGGLVLYLYAKKHLSNAVSVALAALYLFNPAALVNGAAWGQVDSVLALLMLMTAIAAMESRWKLAVPLFVVSALAKPQALLFAPIGGMWLVFEMLAEKQAARRKAILVDALAGLGIALGCALVIVLPFSIHQEWNWLFKLYGETLGSYAYATLNTANLYYLIGANWKGLAELVPGWLMLAGAAVFALASGSLMFSRTQPVLCRNLKKARVLSALFAAMAVLQLGLFLFDASYAVYGYAMMAFAYLFAIICIAFDRRKGALPAFMAIALIGVYMLGVKVHERYLFPALLLLIAAYIHTRDRRLLALCIGFSASTFVNTAIVLENAILFGAEQGHLNADTLALNNTLCVINLLLLGYAVWIGMSGLRESVCEEREEAAGESRTFSYEQMLLNPQDHRLHLKRWDVLCMAIVTVAYSVLAFTNLGSTAAPQTAWVSTASDETVVLELDESQTFSVLYYAGVSYNNFSIAVSEDGENWSVDYPCEMREGLCYRWMYAVESTASNGTVSFDTQAPSNVLWLTGKYLRVNAEEAGLNLWEVVVRGEDGANLPLRVVSHENARQEMLDESKPAAHLVDEIDTCVGEPGWYTGTYFDEIYHGRTAYEHLHGQTPYETTHPPLGKLMMSVGIAIFGMTPFGWRFAGAFIGVLMLPALYLLALQLTHKRSIATVSMTAFALDLMHYAQTRIATIDSFPVFFILLSYLFMVRYMQMDAFAVTDEHQPKLWDRAFLRTLIPLFLSGVCMGLSIASKWIGCYSAVGLAVLFFLTIYRHYRASNVAWEMEDSPRINAAQDFTLKRILITCLFCVGFFVLVPCFIYYLSYIPYLSPNGPVTLRRLIAAQEGMLSYHSTPGLGMDHPFQSPWYEWPFIRKPMWFAQDYFEPAGYASTIMCLGNPWVFYIGAVAMAAVLLCCAGKYIRIQHGRIALRSGDGNLVLVIICVAFLAQYLPWVLVPRSMYIYHYFASVPFIILSTAWLMEKLAQRKPELGYALMIAYLIGALVFFVAFFPYASGWLTSTKWLDALKGFSRLYY